MVAIDSDFAMNLPGSDTLTGLMHITNNSEEHAALHTVTCVNWSIQQDAQPSSLGGPFHNTKV